MTDAAGPSTVPIPSLPGTYALILHLSKSTEIEVGKLGRAVYPGGFYVYVGSALGSGGLAGRLKHHRKPTTSAGWRARWHIDYFRHYAKLVEIWYGQYERRYEHDWAAACQCLSGSSIVQPIFGSSDCRCPSHFFHFSILPRSSAFQQELKKRFPNHDRVVVERLRL